MKPKLHCAKIIITNIDEPIINGALLIDDNIIQQVGQIDDFGDLNQYSVIDHENSLICPGYINLHTHLTYTNASGIDGADGLFPWIKSLLQKTWQWEEGVIRKSIKDGIQELISTGTTYIVENFTDEISVNEISQSPLKCLAGIEVFGSSNESEIFNQYLEIMDSLKYKNIEFTFSPHAPYNLSKELWNKLSSWSTQNNKPLLTHLEESANEKLWWQEKRGKLLHLWEETGSLQDRLAKWEKYNSGIDFLHKNNLISNKLIAAHLCEASKEDLEILKGADSCIVHCPRSNQYLNNKIPKISNWEDLGLPWGLGTDSKASNVDLDILSELRFTLEKQKSLYNYEMPARKAFEHITKISAQIIGKQNKIGVLREKSYADFLVYDNIEQLISSNTDPYEHMIFKANNKKDLKEVWVNGNKIFSLETV